MATMLLLETPIPFNSSVVTGGNESIKKVDAAVAGFPARSAIVALHTCPPSESGALGVKVAELAETVAWLETSTPSMRMDTEARSIPPSASE